MACSCGCHHKDTKDPKGTICMSCSCAFDTKLGDYWLPHHTEYYRDRSKGIENYDYDNEGNRKLRYCKDCGRRIKKRGFAKVCRYCDTVDRLGYSNTKSLERSQKWRDRLIPWRRLNLLKDVWTVAKKSKMVHYVLVATLIIWKAGRMVGHRIKR